MVRFTIAFNQNKIIIQAPNSLAEEIQNNVFSAAIRKDNTLGEDYKIIQENTVFQLEYNQQVLVRSSDPAKILYVLEWNIVDNLIAQSNQYFQFHGAALTFLGQAYLFVGGPGLGKTSLAVLLARHGFNILSDEVGLVSPKDFTVHPFPRNLIIKPHLKTVINVPQNRQPLMIDRNDNGQETAWFLSPKYFKPDNDLRARQLSKIFLLESVPGRTFKIEKAGHHQSFNALMEQFFNAARMKDSYEKLVRLVQKIPFYTLGLSRPLLFGNEICQSLKKQLSE